MNNTENKSIAFNAKPASATFVQMEQLVLPDDTNTLNTLFGGQLLKWIDVAGAMAAIKLSRREVVTVAIDSVDFRLPIHLGDMVKLTAKVTWTGKTSMEVKVSIFCENPRSGVIRKTNEAFMTFVALDDDGRSVDVPQIIPESDEEKEDYTAARERRNYRLSRYKK